MRYEELATAEPSMRGKLQWQKRGLILYKYSTGNGGVIDTVLIRCSRVGVCRVKSSLEAAEGSCFSSEILCSFNQDVSWFTNDSSSLTSPSIYNKKPSIDVPTYESAALISRQLGHAEDLKNSAKPYDKEHSPATTK